MKWIALVVCLMLPSLAAAQDLPALFNVTGVASDDVLNVRAGPGASNPIIGALAHDQRGVEIVERSANGWGLTNIGEGAGWVSMRYLARAAQDPWWSLAQPMICSGTEPFWDMSIRFDRADLRTMASGDKQFTLDWNMVPFGRPPHVVGFGGRDGPVQLSGVMRLERCNDGMSDREFGLSVDFFAHGGGPLEGYSGCCQVTR